MATQAQCQKALDLHEQALSNRRNVVGLGIVPVEDVTKHPGRLDLAVAVYVKKKLPKSRLAVQDIVPEELEVRGKSGVVKVPTKVIEQGEVRLEPLG